MAYHHQLHLCGEFILGVGTVPIDIPTGKVVLLYNRCLARYTLPSGKKEFGETLEAAAVRVTDTQSGIPSHMSKHLLPASARGLDGLGHEDPIAVQQGVSNGGRRAISFWYIVQVDWSNYRRPDFDDTDDVYWVPLAEAAAKCFFGHERRIIERAAEVVRGLVPPQVESLALVQSYPESFEAVGE